MTEKIKGVSCLNAGRAFRGSALIALHCYATPAVGGRPYNP